MNPPRLADITEPEFWLSIGLGGIGFVALVVALNAVEAPTMAVLAAGMVFGWLIAAIQRLAKDRIAARRDNEATGSERDVQL
jgi:hypothetical protein